MMYNSKRVEIFQFSSCPKWGRTTIIDTYYESTTFIIDLVYLLVMIREISSSLPSIENQQLLEPLSAENAAQDGRTR